jgi:hypothetical protein
MSPFPAGVAPTAPQHKLARQVAVEARSETQICDLCICHDLNLPQNRALWAISLIALAVDFGPSESSPAVSAPQQAVMAALEAAIHARRRQPFGHLAIKFNNFKLLHSMSESRAVLSLLRFVGGRDKPCHDGKDRRLKFPNGDATANAIRVFANSRRCARLLIRAYICDHIMT